MTGPLPHNEDKGCLTLSRMPLSPIFEPRDTGIKTDVVFGCYFACPKMFGTALFLAVSLGLAPLL